MKKVKLLIYNWHQVGSTQDGSGESYDRFVVGEKSVKSIEEISVNGQELFNYLVTMEDGVRFRVFNPNFVEYFPL